MKDPMAAWLGTQCQFQTGGDNWMKWSQLRGEYLRKTMITSGPGCGGWTMETEDALRLGAVGTAALRALVLSVQGYQPMYRQ